MWQITLSSIIDPNSMVHISRFRPSTTQSLNLATSLTSLVVINTIKEYIERNFHFLEDKLQTILEEALFTKGAYVEAIIPEACRQTH